MVCNNLLTIIWYNNKLHPLFQRNTIYLYPPYHCWGGLTIVKCWWRLLYTTCEIQYRHDSIHYIIEISFWLHYIQLCKSNSLKLYRQELEGSVLDPHSHNFFYIAIVQWHIQYTIFYYIHYYIEYFINYMCNKKTTALS